MSVSVLDCMNLPALREAKLVAGKAGIDRIISNVSVLEHVDATYISENILVGNELVISALISVKDDLEQQCNLIHHLNNRGVSCLVVYYVGIYLKNLDERLINTANEIGFPLITIPFGRTDFRYCDLIFEVMELIIQDRQSKQYFASDMLKSISLKKPYNRTLDDVLRLLSDRLHSTLIFTDNFYETLGFASWPFSNKGDFQNIIDIINCEIPSLKMVPIKCMYNGEDVYVVDININTKNFLRFHLIIIYELKIEMNKFLLAQAKEVIELYLGIWGKKIDYACAANIVLAILNNDEIETMKIAKNMNFDISHIHTMWILKNSQNSRFDTNNDSLNSYIMNQFNTFLSERYKIVLANEYEKEIVAFCGDLITEELSENEVANDFSNILSLDGIEIYPIICKNINDSKRARDAYIQISKYFESSRIIYPYNKSFIYNEIKFAGSCEKIIEGGDAVEKVSLDCIQRILKSDDADNMIETLGVYFFDADMNIHETGNIMFLHKNTIKYRLNKIKTIMGYDVTKMPNMLEIYKAIGVIRLKKYK